MKIFSTMLSRRISSRSFWTASRLLAPNVKAAKGEESKKLREKKIALQMSKAKAEARKPADQDPLFMEVGQALRFLRAAEVGRDTQEASISIHTKIVSERGVTPLQGAIRLPKPLKETRVLCLSTNPQRRQEALDAGATDAKDVAFIDEIASGKADLNYDKIVATPDMEPFLRKVARILGPKGLMPTARRDTVVEDVGSLIQGLVGTQPFRERNGAVALAIARCNFEDADVVRNVIATSEAVREAISKIKTKKPILIGQTVLSSTHGPGIVINF